MRKTCPEGNMVRSVFITTKRDNHLKEIFEATNFEAIKKHYDKIFGEEKE